MFYFIRRKKNDEKCKSWQKFLYNIDSNNKQGTPVRKDQINKFFVHLCRSNAECNYSCIIKKDFGFNEIKCDKSFCDSFFCWLRISNRMIIDSIYNKITGILRLNSEKKNVGFISLEANNSTFKIINGYYSLDDEDNENPSIIVESFEYALSKDSGAPKMFHVLRYVTHTIANAFQIIAVIPHLVIN
ncbi:hypothetical protein EDEG_03112 [Edhazardia aedis USNM 41457]|uniref:Uncharacterized protein n=1 Tax=Edhazardia aedis (strain USNM 41457) TaxID=1003232 RepID=J9DM88_EDHAE|nr:hypothetical protein EDEG_03112 [Edhazardia aedis USNM 41457]|eukprot:EJW02492.1 hypothetical protein EDEG_03112 [Edhazardia aedis USNM 41457]